MQKEPCDIAAQIIRHYGAEHQKDILVEECAELIQATEKSRRQSDAPELTADMVEEMADVYIMIMQFESIMGPYWSGLFDKTVEDKLVQQMGRIEAEKEDT
jgi:NTP pyrophosphatase (non-canonical NTP hydrolase)